MNRRLMGIIIKTIDMKKLCYLLLLTFIYNGFAQGSKLADEQRIEQVIHQFFEALETRDTLLMKQTTMADAQIWRRRNNKAPVEIDMRFRKDDLREMPSYPKLREVPLSFEILVGNGIAMAWVPYRFWIEDAFSHCGTDAVTLFEVEGEWKIISMAYTVETENCD